MKNRTRFYEILVKARTDDINDFSNRKDNASY